MRLRIPISLGAGVAMALAFEPVGLWPLLPVSLAVLLWAVHHRGVAAGALLGGVYGAGFLLTLIFWMRVIGYDAWIALSLFQTLYLVAAGAGLAAVSRLRWWPLWSAVVWVGVEVVRGSWPMGGFTWGRAAFATVDTPYAAWLPWAGMNGVGLLVVLSAGLLLWSGRHARARPRAVAVGAAVAAVGFVLPALVSPPLSSAGSATVAVVQGDVPGDGDNLIAYHREVTRSHLDLTRELADDVEAGEVPRPDLVLWPENSTAVDPFLDREIRAGLDEVTTAVGAPVLVGAIVDAPDESQVLNQGIVYEPGSGAGDRYTKRHPVPFGEYIPYRAAIGSGTFGRLDQIPRDMMSGTRSSPLRVDGLLLAAAICFDVAYDDALGEQVRGGADLLTVQTSNALFIHTGQIEQQWQISRARALETGRTVVVAAVNGRSGVIGADGEVQAGITPRTREVLVQEVALVAGTPPALVVGPWLGRATVPLAVCAVLWAVLPYRRPRRTAAAREPGRTTAGSRQ